MTEKNGGRARARGAARETTNCTHSSSIPHALASYLNLSRLAPDESERAQDFADDMVKKFGERVCETCGCRLRLCAACGSVYVSVPCGTHPLAGGAA